MRCIQIIKTQVRVLNAGGSLARLYDSTNITVNPKNLKALTDAKHGDMRDKMTCTH